MFLKPNKAIYGTVTAALLLLFYNSKLVGKPMDFGFEMNLYECCWKKINHQHFTIVPHIDNLKLSHKDPKQVSWNQYMQP